MWKTWRMTRRRLCLASLAAAFALLPVALAGCGGGGEEAAPPAEPAPAEPAPAEPAPAEPGGDAAAGAEIWASAGCASCHVLAAAEATGTVGPNLDELKPSFDATVEQVTNGGGGMPAFADQLSEQEIEDLAQYIVESTSG
jgi:mono/diheme cytochrome c family protein